MFQRPYVWNMKEHWEPLWEDIRDVANRLEYATEEACGKTNTGASAAPLPGCHRPGTDANGDGLD